MEDEKADKELKSFEVQLEVKPEYHPKLIGRGGQVIKQLRTDFDVNIQLPKKSDTNDDSTIIITGYEKNANQARDAILKIINEFVSNSNINLLYYFKKLNYSALVRISMEYKNKIIC